MTTLFFGNPDFEEAARAALGKSAQGTIDIGIVLATLERIIDGDPSSWFNEWKATADALRRQAIAADCAGLHETASYFYLASADQYGCALTFIGGMAGEDNLAPTFARHRECWDGFIASSLGSYIPLAIAYEGETMPGYMFRPDTAGAARPTVIVTNGSDEPLSSLWASCIKHALKRRWNVVVFDGPGQQSMLFERDIPFRHDWEAVLTPVVDSVIARGDVDETALFAYGVSQGGYWLTRALAFEHRFVAAVVDGGVTDVARAWYSILPPASKALLDAGEREAFDENFTTSFTDLKTSSQFAFRARPYGHFESIYDLFIEVGRYNVKDIIGSITTPMLIADPEDEQLFTGQSRELFDALSSPKVLARFTANEGANHHCQPLARTSAGLRICDFFQDRLRFQTR